MRRARPPSRPTRLGYASETSAPSSGLTSCERSTCAALAVPTSCVVDKKKGTSETCFSLTEKHAIIVPVAASSRLLAPLPTCSRSMCVTGFPPQRIALLPRYFSWRPRSCLFEGLAAAGNIICMQYGRLRAASTLPWCGVSQVAVARRVTWRRA